MKPTRSSCGLPASWRATLAMFAAAGLLAGAALSPRPAYASSKNPDTPREISGFATAFTRICHDLSSARDQLTLGKVNESSFTDRVLELFVQADSLRAALGASPWVREPGPAVALERGYHYLIVSLRENYFGITERDGQRFASADEALRTAVAWRGDAASTDAVALP